MKRLLMVAMTVAAVTLGLGATAQAAPRPAGTVVQEAQADRAARVEADSAEVQALTPYVSGERGQVSFDQRAALRAGRDARVVAEFAAGLEAGATHARVSCPGITYGPYYRPFYYAMFMNACDARAVAAVAAGGGSVATIAGAIIAATGVGAPAGLVVAIAGGVVALGGAVLNFCNRYGRGVLVRSYGYCRSQ